MKNLKIRFIKENNIYHLQCKKFGIWIDVTTQTSGGAYETFSSEDKSRSLNKYLNYTGKCKQCLNITEYPTIKKY